MGVQSMHHIDPFLLTSPFSFMFLSLNETVPLMVPKARVCPSGDQEQQMIFYLYFSLGISGLSGVYIAKSAPLPLNSSCVRGLKVRHRTASAWLNLSNGSIFFSAITLNFHTTHVLSFDPVASVLPSLAKAMQLMGSFAE